jgi:Zn-dependent M28 family amino/carboxypeptidase
MGLTLRFRYDNNESNLLRRSDHWPFLQSGVPAVWFHTGLHPDYHTPDDDPERIEYEKMTRIVRLVHQTSWDVANADERPELQAMGSRPGS